MKKLTLIFAIVCLLFSCSNGKKFTISGTFTDIENTDNSIMLYLKTLDVEGEMVIVDSVVIKANGTFVLQGKSSESDIFVIAGQKNSFSIPIFVDAGKNITITGSSVDYGNLKIEGSESNMLYESYFASIKSLKEEQESIRERYYMLSYNTTLSKEELYTAQEELIALYEELGKDIENKLLEFVGIHPNHVVSAYLIYMNTHEMSTSSEIEAQLQLLDPKMNNKYAKLAKEHLDCVKKTEVGQIFPIIELPDPNGNLISTESFHGKYLYVDFWASWCKPCVKEIPNLKIAYQQYHDKGFEILGISLDDDKNAWMNCITTFDLNWVHISDLKGFKSQIAKEIAVNYIPHTFLIDPNGVILAVDLRGEYLLNKLAELMQ